ncbi:MAG: 50S ribosomal protein L15 [Bacteroidota bacterium]
MDLSKLSPAKGATKNRKRIGRGAGSRGGTSTKGHKGQKSRSGASIPAWFEGGQMPLVRRIPKFGFTNRNRVEYRPLNVSQLAALVEAGKLSADGITPEALIEAGVIKKKDRVKVLGNGDLSAALTVTAHKFSKSARTKIEAAGGTATEA